MVIAPDFTVQSVQECVDFSFNNDTQILLITDFEGMDLFKIICLAVSVLVGACEISVAVCGLRSCHTRA